MKNISREFQLDGSVICTGGADPTRTATFQGPANSPDQEAAVQAFFADEPDLDENGLEIVAAPVGLGAKVKALFGFGG